MDVKHSPEIDALRSARWFAGKQREVVGAAHADRVGIPGTRASVGLLDVSYADGGVERYLALAAGDGREPGPDDGAWSALVHALAARGELAGERGALVLRPGAALEALLPPSGAAERVVSLDQSNSLTAVGDRLLVKAYRRPVAGVHPELELSAALAGRGAPVPAYAGAVVHLDPDGRETAVALLQELVAGAESGWEPPIARVAVGADLQADAAGYRRVGAAAADLHRALAAALGTAPDEAGAGAGRRDEALALLDEALGAEPALEALAPAAREALEGLAHVPGPLQRIHGDLHVGQLLHAGGRVLIIDLEGHPLFDLEARRAPDTPLRDVASLVRSIDHVASAAQRRTSADAGAWRDAAVAAALAGYEETAGAPVDRSALRAREVASDLATLVYAQRVLPEWAYAPRRGLDRLLGSAR